MVRKHGTWCEATFWCGTVVEGSLVLVSALDCWCVFSATPRGCFALVCLDMSILSNRCSSGSPVSVIYEHRDLGCVLGMLGLVQLECLGLLRQLEALELAGPVQHFWFLGSLLTSLRGIHGEAPSDTAKRTQRYVIVCILGSSYIG